MLSVIGFLQALKRIQMFTKEKVLEAYNFYYEKLFRRLDDEAGEKFGERYTEVHKWRIINDVLLLPEVSKEERVLEIGPSLTSLIIKKTKRLDSNRSGREAWLYSRYYYCL